MIKRAAVEHREVDFNVTSVERETISKIVARATKAGLCGSKHWYKPLTATMDLTACHRNGNPLRLADLLAADDFNFLHDIAGIARHMDRSTGRLTGFFRPRFSAPANDDPSDPPADVEGTLAQMTRVFAEDAAVSL